MTTIAPQILPDDSPREETERETLRRAIHAIEEFNYDSCDHGTFTSGPNSGEPYQMCDHLAESLIALGWQRRPKKSGLVDLEAIRKDSKSLMFVSDGSRGSDKVGRLLNSIPALLAEVERLRLSVAEMRRDENGKAWRNDPRNRNFGEVDRDFR